VLHRFLSGPKTANVIAQCYFAVFYFALGSGPENVLSDTYAAYVAIDLALCLMKEKGSPLND
jgi:hypothetical protein